MLKDYKISRVSQSDMALFIQWAADAGWNPGLHDATCFYATDPHGFFMGKLGGIPIAMGSAVLYDQRFAFCGFYIVDPVYRGHGYGLELTHARLAYVGARNAGIDGVLDMLDKYARLGYQVAHHNARYVLQSLSLKDVEPEHPRIDLLDIPFSLLADYDERHFPARRETFLKCWIHQAGASAFAVMKEGHLKGYGVLRPCIEGFKIGPLFAETESIANSLFLHLVKAADGASVYLDCPLNNPHAMALVKRYGLKQVFETARMYLKEEPNLPIHEIYGITSFELG